MKREMNCPLNSSNVYFREYDHTYWLGDKQLFGLTGVISKHLFPDKYSNIPERILRNAAERGSRIHDDCVMVDEFEEIQSDEASLYAELKSKEVFSVIASEYIVTDKEHFATAIDKVFVKNNLLCLGDIKTTYTLDKEYLSWQLSINAFLFEKQNTHLKIEKLYGIWIRDKAQMVEIERKPNETVEQLLTDEINGDIFINPYLVVATESQNDNAIILIKEIADIAQQIEELKNIKAEYDAKIEQLFRETGLEKWETDLFTITKKKGYTKEVVDSKKLKENNPEIYKQYIKTSQVKPTIITKLK